MLTADGTKPRMLNCISSKKFFARALVYCLCVLVQEAFQQGVMERFFVIHSSVFLLRCEEGLLVGKENKYYHVIKEDV